MDNWRAGFLTEETRPADRADRGEDRSLEVPPRPAGGAEDPNRKEGDAEQRGGDVRGVEEPKGAAGGAEDPEGAVGGAEGPEGAAGGAEVVQQQVLSTTPIMLILGKIFLLVYHRCHIHSQIQFIYIKYICREHYRKQ